MYCFSRLLNILKIILLFLEKTLENLNNIQVSNACRLSLRNNNNFINSFVNRLKMKYFNKQFISSYTSSSGNKKFGFHRNMNKLNPYYVTGFTDGEGCFLINIRPNTKLKTGYSIELVFKIGVHLRDRALLENIRNYFGVGTVTIRSDGIIQY